MMQCRRQSVVRQRRRCLAAGEMISELQTSHCYEDADPPPPLCVHGASTAEQGCLGASLYWNAQAGAYCVQHVVVGDRWDESRCGSVCEGHARGGGESRRRGTSTPPWRFHAPAAHVNCPLTFSPCAALPRRCRRHRHCCRRPRPRRHRHRHLRCSHSRCRRHRRRRRSPPRGSPVQSFGHGQMTH